MSRYPFDNERNRYGPWPNTAVLRVNKIVAPMGPVRPVQNGDKILEGHTIYLRDVVLLNGEEVSAFYSIANNRKPQINGFEQSREAIIAAFIWVLETPAFADGVPSNKERGIEVGNIMSAAIGFGLDEAEVLICYNTAYIYVKQNA